MQKEGRYKNTVRENTKRKKNTPLAWAEDTQRKTCKTNLGEERRWQKSNKKGRVDPLHLVRKGEEEKKDFD